MNETWIPIVGFEGRYEVSSQGRVKAVARCGRKELILKPAVAKSGHLRVNLTRNGKYRTRLVHQLVLTAFAGPAPYGLDGCHNNGDALDNRVENLRWDTRRSNILDLVAHGNHYNARKTACPLGHEYTERNGERICKACQAKRAAEYRERLQ